MGAQPDDLDLEARLIAAYLVDRESPPGVIERYRRATELLLADPLGPTDRALMDVVRRHPSLLPLLDGASGVVRPDSVLRKKVLMMLALLETSPEFADWFEPPSRGRARALVDLLGLGALSAFQVFAGLLLWPLILIRARLSRTR